MSIKYTENCVCIYLNIIKNYSTFTNISKMKRVNNNGRLPTRLPVKMMKPTVLVWRIPFFKYQYWPMNPSFLVLNVLPTSRASDLCINYSYLYSEIILFYETMPSKAYYTASEKSAVIWYAEVHGNWVTSRHFDRILLFNIMLHQPIY